MNGISEKPTVTMVINGACRGNPGPGTWACLLWSENQEQKLTGSEPYTTDYRMKLEAAIQGFRKLKKSSAVTVYTSSEYVQRGMTHFHLHRWGWNKKGPDLVLDLDLWQTLGAVTRLHEVTWLCTRGQLSHTSQGGYNCVATCAAQAPAPSEQSPAEHQPQARGQCYIEPASISDVMHEQLDDLLNHKHTGQMALCSDCDRLQKATAVLLAPSVTTRRYGDRPVARSNGCDTNNRFVLATIARQIEGVNTIEPGSLRAWLQVLVVQPATGKRERPFGLLVLPVAQPTADRRNMVTVSRKIKGRRVQGSGTTKADAMHDMEENQRRSDDLTAKEIKELVDDANIECYVEELAKYDAALSVLEDKELAHIFVEDDLREVYDDRMVRQLTRHINRIVPEKAKIRKAQLKVERMKWS